MVYINLKNVCFELPIYGQRSRSLKHTLFNNIIGGVFKNSNSGIIFIHALNNINLEIKSGDRIGIIGNNGSGKTTLLRILAGIYQPSSGKITSSGSVSCLLSISLGPDSEATGLENIFLRMRLLGFTSKYINSVVDEIVCFSGLGAFINLPMRTYSSGMVMRLLFSISTCINSDILIMDEWLSVGDDDFLDKAQKRLMDLISKTQILIIASHDKQLLNNICNKIITLENGNIINITTL